MANKILMVGLTILSVSTSISANNRSVVNQNHVDQPTYKVILAEELNIYRDTLYLNNSLQYYSNSWNFGIQSNNVRLDGAQMQNFENDSYVNASYKFSLPYDFGLEAGGQIGTNMNEHTQRLHIYNFVDVSRSFFDGQITIHGGGFYVNDTLALKHQPFNLEAGVEIKAGQFITTLDYSSGSNNMSGTSAIVYYKATNYLRPYVGVLVPETNSGNEFAGVVGFTLSLSELAK